MIVNIKNGEIESKNLNVDFNSEKTFYEFFHCHSAEQVEIRMKNISQLNEINWKNINGAGDFGASALTGQMTTSEKSLTELLQNSFDALVEKLSKENTDNLNFDEATRWIKNKYTEKELKEQVYLISTGVYEEQRGKHLRKMKNEVEECLSFTIIDKGIGQNKENFEKTFLSVSSGIKNGKKRMSGVLGLGQWSSPNWCRNEKEEKKGYTLVISKTEDSSIWSWTITRIFKLSGDDLPIIQYLTINDVLPTFESKSISVIPDPNDDDKYYGSPLFFGSLKKLYSYHLDVKSTITKDLRYKLNKFLPKPAFTTRILERRIDSKTGKPMYDKDRNRNRDSWLRGFFENSLKSKQTEDEESLLYYTSDYEINKLPVDILVLKDEYVKTCKLDSSVYFILNGQTVGTLSNSFLSTDFGVLKNNIKILVDYSSLSKGRLFDGILKGNDRDGINENNEFNIDIKEKLLYYLNEDVRINELKEEFVVNLVGKDDNSEYKKNLKNMLKDWDYMKNFLPSELDRLRINNGSDNFFEHGGPDKNTGGDRKYAKHEPQESMNFENFCQNLSNRIQVVHLESKWKKVFFDLNDEIVDIETDNSKYVISYDKDKKSKRITISLNIDPLKFVVKTYHLTLRFFIKNKSKPIEVDFKLSVKDKLPKNNSRQVKYDSFEYYSNLINIQIPDKSKWDSSNLNSSKITQIQKDHFDVTMNPNSEYIMNILNGKHSEKIKEMYLIIYKGFLLVHMIGLKLGLTNMIEKGYFNDDNFVLESKLEEHLESSLINPNINTNKYFNEKMKKGE